MTAVLYVAARAPRPGFAKTRLGQTIGHEQANALYAAFVQDLAARLAVLPFPVGWYVTPEDAWEALAGLVYPSGERGPRPGPVLVQGPGDWAARQQALFAGAAARGERRTILIASDSPQVALAPIAEAFALLERHDLVLGPVDDGGYYLVGMRGSHPVLGGVPMSTGTVLDEIVAKAEALGLSVALVAPTFDVDESDDLARLAALIADRDDLPATRAALERLGLLVPARDDLLAATKDDAPILTA
jgi:rSAM/selenodomain-associated transferase 1